MCARKFKTLCSHYSLYLNVHFWFYFLETFFWFSTTNKSSAVADMVTAGPKSEGCALPLSVWVRAGSPSNTMSPGSKPTSVPSGILIHPAFGQNRHGPKIGGCAPFGRGELGPHLTQYGLCRGLPPYQVACWSIQPLATIDMGQKLRMGRLLCPFGGSRVPI